jgi:hypothetical protein
MKPLTLLLALALSGCAAFDRHPALMISASVVVAGYAARDRGHDQIVTVRVTDPDCKAQAERCK